MAALPLVFFTVLSQTAVGGFVILLLANRFAMINLRQLTSGLIACSGLFILATVIGALHFGPLLSINNVISGIAGSSLRQETLMAGIFVILACVASGCAYFNIGSKTFCIILAWLAALAGLAFVLIIPAVYRLQAVAGWDTHFTNLLMLMTVIIGGGALAALFGAVRIGLVLSMLAIVVTALSRPWYLAFLSSVQQTQTGLLALQLTLLAIGFVSLFVLLKKPDHRILISYLSLVLVAEFAGRAAFYNLWA